jgi:hypothetical protein
VIAERRSTAPAVLYRLPRTDVPSKELQGRLDDLPGLIANLGDRSFDGVVTILARPNVLVLLLVEGSIEVAHLESSDAPAEGQVALRDFVARTDPHGEAHTQITPLSRPVAESLCAALDAEPMSTPLQDVAGLREILRHLVSLHHHGVADLSAADGWARVMFNHGQVLGAYHSTDPNLLPSLSALGRLLGDGSATLTVRRAPDGTLPRLSWPSAVPSPAVATPAAPERALPRDDERDERVENNLLWLLSNVDRDRERAAAKSSGAEGAVLQVLASFANSIYRVAAQLVASGPQPHRLPGLRDVVEQMQSRHPLLEELEISGDQIDAAGLVKRYKALPRDGGYAADFYGGVGRSVLAITQHAAGTIVQQVSDPEAALRCATAVEAWIFSVEMTLPAPRRSA